MIQVPVNVLDSLGSRNLSLCLLVQSGSKAYGIDVEGSDDDFVGVFVPPLAEFLSIDGFGPETHAGNGPDLTLHELGKFCRLGLKGNPAILETLWNPNLVSQTSTGEALVGLKAFLTDEVFLPSTMAWAGSSGSGSCLTP